MKLSIILPVFNTDKYLEESLMSVLSQMKADYELIMANDGSNDESYEIITRFLNEKAKNIHYTFYNTPDNQGYHSIMKELANLARGEFMAIQDSDDISLPGRFQKCLQILEADPNLFAVSGALNLIDQNGKPKEQWYNEGLTPSQVAEILPSGNCIANPSVMFRKQMFEEIGGYRNLPHISRVADYDLWLRALFHDFRMCSIKEALVNYRVHSENHSMGANSLETKEQTDNLRNLFRDNKLY